jgi:hypothetical protein
VRSHQPISFAVTDLLRYSPAMAPLLTCLAGDLQAQATIVAANKERKQNRKKRMKAYGKKNEN